MILEHKTMEVLNKAIDKLDSINYDVVMEFHKGGALYPSDTESKVSDAKDVLITLRDEIQADVDKFEEWANEEMKKEEWNPGVGRDKQGYLPDHPKYKEDNYDEVKPLDDLRKILVGDDVDGGNYDKEKI